jgi:hypothetical protein
MSYVSASVVAVVLATSSQIWAIGAVGGGGFGGIGSASSFGGEMQFRTAGVDGRVVCTRCRLAEVRSAQPDLIGLYEFQHRQGQVVMQLVRSLDANDAAWWMDIAGPTNTLSVRTPDHVFAQLMAEENLNRQVAIRGLLRTNRTYDVVSVTFLDEGRQPLRTGQAPTAADRAEAAARRAEKAATEAEGAANNSEATARTGEAQLDNQVQK